ncbi:hypothetical protein LUZ60_012712 [Juncus effusus]|nr:hypothetical protein LUZ60_012712 [Juncus effusus]
MDQTRGNNREYLSALEVERNKVELFQRELPLCLQLVNETIEKLKKQIEKEQSECEDLISINLNLSTSENEEDAEDKSDKEKDWSQTLQLWNEKPDETQPPKDQTENLVMVETRHINSELHSAESEEDESKKKDKKEKGEEKEKEDSRKTRRCWSPELHRHFVQALEQLGGPHVATPKQIREVMKVEGLTNDEVKSHLQKYRLHSKKPSSRTSNNNNNNNNNSPTRAPQFVLVGAWVPPPDCNNSENSTISPTNIIYPSIVSLPANFILANNNQERSSQRRFNGSPKGPLEKRPTGDDGNDKSNSSQNTVNGATSHLLSL